MDIPTIMLHMKQRLTLHQDQIHQDTIWPFNSQAFHFVLNMAIGWPDLPNNAVQFPAVMEVDYVRVYDRPLPSIVGARVVRWNRYLCIYKVFRGHEGDQYIWSVPDGARILYGQDSSRIVVDMHGVPVVANHTFDFQTVQISCVVINSVCDIKKVIRVDVDLWPEPVSRALFVLALFGSFMLFGRIIWYILCNLVCCCCCSDKEPPK